MAISRGAALADFNMDGLLDLVVVNRWESAKVWRNTSTNAGHWIEVKLQQPGANRDAIGAWLEVKHGENGDAPRNLRGRRLCQRPEWLVAFWAG